jgi:glycosyltransferase involved in cell wall biosynthesis
VSAANVDIRLESPLPATLPAGTATALFCSGTASAGDEPVATISLRAGGDWQALRAVARARFDRPVRRSGFWGIVPCHTPEAPGRMALQAIVNGSRRVVLGEIEVVARHPAPASRGAEHEPIAVCLATFNPNPRLLRGQIDSLRAQTDTDWVCLISDDASDAEPYAVLQTLVAGDSRFTVSRSSERIGFYRNFERALMMAPGDCALIALCDQDDVWHPDKLARLRAGLGRAALAYSDMRLVDDSGHVLRDTLWRGRANNHTNLASMLVANTVTGAACLMRREVAARALPFPDSPGIEFHDHWLALVAMTCGELAYLDEPLYDYVQHRGAILGKVTAERPARRPIRRRPRLRRWRAAYFLGYVPGQVRAATLLLRGGEDLPPERRRALQAYLRADRSLLRLLWLAARPLRRLAGRNETLAGEWDLLPGLIWFRLARRLPLDTRFPDPPVFEHRRLRRWRAGVRG